jgi:DNA-binding response OmpR family regulator
MAPYKKPTNRRSLSILVADDDRDTLTTLAAMLADEGHVVHICAKATYVLQAIQRYKPDVCVIDIVMPDKTGFSIARDIFALKLPVRPTLIALSGVFTRPSDDVVAKSVGFDYFVRKGTDPSELLRIINHLAGDGAPTAA